MKTGLCLFLAVVGGWSAKISAAPSVSAVPTLPVTTHGQTVTIFGDGFPNAPIKVYLRTGNEGKDDPGFPIAGLASADGKSLTFKVPDDAPAGDFLVVLGIDTQQIPVPGELRITPDAAAKVSLDAIAPGTDYLGDNKSGFDFVIAGTNLARQAGDNIVIVVDHGPLSAGSAAECASQAAMDASRKICLSYEPGMEGQKLTVANYHPQHYEGPVSFEIKVGNNLSNPVNITFSRIRPETLRWAAIALFCLIAGIVFLLVYRGIEQSRLAGESTGVLAAFFLDRQTNSFSLSKFQVIAWTTVAVFGYVYLFLCRTCIQWTFSFPPIPANLPTLLGLSAGTTVAAMGITATHGSKGSGPIHPSMADFISTGGLVSGERFQFFVWTIIGCLGFLALILAADPASLTQMPDIQGTFLTLMGVSSVGYLAGKFVRQPGPIIELLTIDEVIPAAGGNPGIMKIQLKGQNLSDDAVIKVDQAQLRIDQFTVTGITKQNQSPNDPFYSEVEVDLLDAEKYRTGSHILFLVNDDGQSACEAFPMNALVLNPVAPILPGADPVTVQLTGKNFASGLSATWVDASKQPSSMDVTVQDENHATVALVPGTAAGTGTLTILTAANLQAVATIRIASRKA